MSVAVYFICASILQLSSAQVLSYVPRNSAPQQLETTRYVANVANPNVIARVPTAVPVANNVANANANLANANIANINAANAIANQNIARDYAIQNYANANYANVASQNAVNAINNAASQNAVNAIATNAANYANAYANQNIAANAIPASIASAVPAIVNPTPIAKPTLANAAVANALTNIDGNTATFNLGTNGNTFTVTSGSPGTPGFGVSIIADALEVGGTVAVNGQIPIFGSVAVNGNLPTDGAATVSYNCGGKQVPGPV